jgi:hypothetical protein
MVVVAGIIHVPYVLLLPAGTIKYTACWHCLDAGLLLLQLQLLVLCGPGSNPQRQCARRMPGKGVA